MAKDHTQFDWNAVVARCLAYLCLQNSKYRDKQLLEQSSFLEKLGLPADAAARVVGSTLASMRELARQAKKKGGGRKNGKPKGR